MARASRNVGDRLCLGCNAIRPKGEMVRVVRAADGNLRLDRDGRLPGRGAYVCPRQECLERALKRHGFDRAYKTHIAAAALEQLRRDLASID